jgi:hypothetical protein
MALSLFDNHGCPTMCAPPGSPLPADTTSELQHFRDEEAVHLSRIHELVCTLTFQDPGLSARAALTAH